jgi:hypothetical protein
MIIKSLRWCLLLAVTTFVSGCYPDGPEYVDQMDLVYSNYDPNTVFKGNGNYYMKDSIVEFTGDTSKVKYVNGVTAKIVLDRVKLNMSSYGYTQVFNEALADFSLVLGTVQSTYTYIYYDYWGGYYGWYYPYYPTYTSYTTGSLVITMVNNENLTPSGRKSVAWTAIANGLIEGTTASFNSRVQKSIDQAYIQSSYLKQ